MRGKPSQFDQETAQTRIIPAHAGQTPPHCGTSCGSPDHPRACGANWGHRRPNPLKTGSSPRMRGKRRERQVSRPHQRIIPAHAGQTIISAQLMSVPPDHPRACGANWISFTPASSSTGSSPRMRGKPFAAAAPNIATRIIPAHAGQTSGCPGCACHETDHPRACGANAAVRRSFMISSGSSPRMRGKPVCKPCTYDNVRIIPAHAGQTHP